jgi:hypothetical protein
MFFATNWWESFGSHCPQLQKFAIRVLSQTCSASGCERNWSVFERIHTKKRNRLEQKRLNDLVFVQYNLWLRRNQFLNKRPDIDPIVLDDVDPVNVYAIIIVLCISIDKSIIRTRSLRNTHSQETQHLSWETL